MTSTRAIRIERHGPPGVLREREIPLAEPAPCEVQLSVQAAGVNFGDLLMRAGLYGTVPPRPYSPGFEVAGIVSRVGPGVSDWHPGDRVLALMRHGGYARDVVVRTEQLFSYPEALTPVQAAAMPVAFLTAWVCLHRAASARKGETVLILGAGGGVGTAAVQLALRHGLRVIGTAGTTEKRDFVTRELGAEACFDSRADWETDVRQRIGPRGIDVALDAVGGPATRSCRRLLAPLGRLIFYGLSEAMPRRKRDWLRVAAAWIRTPRFHPLSLVVPNLGVFGVHLLHLGSKQPLLREAMQDVWSGVGEGNLCPVVDRTFDLDRTGAMEAHAWLHARKNLGKVVLVAGEG